MEKLIVGCGYLGRRVARLWIEQGHTVRALTRGRAEELRAQGIEPIVGDLLKLVDLAALVPAATVLFAVAPDRRSRQDDPYAVWDRGLLHLIAIAREWPVRPRLLFISSTGVYGHTTGEEVDETTPTEPADASGRALLAAEEMLREDLWVDAVILRFAGIYGPGRLIRAEAIRAGEPIPADPEKWLNLIHVDDGATAVLAAEARATPGEIYNVSDGSPVRRRGFYTHLAYLLQAPEPCFKPPEPGTAAPRHDRADRRVSNRRLREELEVTLRYPSYREGLAASFNDDRECR